MKAILLTLTLFIFCLFSLETAQGRPNRGNSHHTYTIFRLSPKQFSKGYQAEKKEHGILMSHSTKKMLRKRNGTWFQRWYNRNF